MTKRIVLAAVILLGCMAGPVTIAHAQPVKTPPVKMPLIRIGVLAKGRVSDCVIRYRPLAEYLTRKVEGYRFAVIPIRFDEFQQAVVDSEVDREVDFVICNPLFYIELQNLGKISAIATMQEQFGDVMFSQYGGVVFCRQNRTDLKTIGDLRGKSIAAVSKSSFGGWVICEAFLLDKGIDLSRDASRVEFLENHPEVIRLVTDGVHDVGIVRTGTLEKMAQTGSIDMADYRVLNATGPTPDFPLVTSTKLYPNWVFAKTNFVEDSLANRVAVALYDLAKESKHPELGRRDLQMGWVTPANYQSVRECVEKVRGEFGRKSHHAFYVFGWYGIFFVAVVGLIATLFYIASLTRKLKATDAMMDRHTESVAMKDEIIQDLKQRIMLIADGEHEDINIIRSDYRIEYLTPEWEANYGPGVGKRCYEYFVDSDEPCEVCGLRESLKSHEVSRIKKTFPRESGRPIEVITIPLVKDRDGIQRFGQIYHDALKQNRKVCLSTNSQESESRFLLLKGIICESKKNPGGALAFLQKARELVEEETPPQKLDLNQTVRQVAEWTSHAWKEVADVSFNLAAERPSVWASEIDVQIVLANLVLNVVHCLRRTAFPPMHKGLITFTTRLQGDSVFLMVMDNGDGRNFMAAKECSAKPGANEENQEPFCKLGLLPAYERVIGKWNAKLRVHRTEENRIIRTVVMQAATGNDNSFFPLDSTGSDVPEMRTADFS